MHKIKRIHLLRAAVGLQALSLVLLIGEIFVEIFKISFIRITWEIREYIEISAIIGLMIGLVLAVSYIRELRARNSKVEGQLRVVAGEFQMLLDEHFAAWGLSKSEKDVAYFAIKGMNNNEISSLRGTSEGTIKAQLNAVYRKAGLESRTQLLGYFIEELMADDQPANNAKN